MPYLDTSLNIIFSFPNDTVHLNSACDGKQLK